MTDPIEHGAAVRYHGSVTRLHGPAYVLGVRADGLVALVAAFDRTGPYATTFACRPESLTVTAPEREARTHCKQGQVHAALMAAERLVA